MLQLKEMSRVGEVVNYCQKGGTKWQGQGIQCPDPAEDHAQHMRNDQPTRPMITATATAEDATRDAGAIKMIWKLSGFMATVRASSSPKARAFSLQHWSQAEGYS